MQDQTMILEEALHESSGPARMTPFTGPIAWTRASLSPDDGIVKISEACRRELDEVVATLRANPLPTTLLHPDDFSLERCREMMREASQLLTEGPGFVIVDRLPMDLWNKQEATAVYWLLAQMVSRPVAQSWDGKMIYDVRDLGKPPGNGVRPDITSAEQNFHTDNSYNLCPPEHVALLCLRPAKHGGVSSIVSFYTVYNQMIERYPHLLPRLSGHISSTVSASTLPATPCSSAIRFFRTKADAWCAGCRIAMWSRATRWRIGKWTRRLAMRCKRSKP